MSQLSELDYRRLFESLPSRYVAFLADDPSFTIVGESDGHANMAMVKRDHVLGKPLFDVWPDVSEKYQKTGVSDLVESLRKVIKTGKPDQMAALRYDIPRPDGNFEVRHWQLTHYPLRDSQGRVNLVYQATEDITGEVVTAQKLQQTKQQLEQALSAGLIGTWLWDIVGDKVVGDKNLAFMFGVPEAEATAGLPLKVFIDSIHEQDRPRVEKAIAATLKKKTTFEQEYRTISRDGTIRWVIARGRVEIGGHGTPVEFPGVLVDITERKHAEQDMRFLLEGSTVLSSSLDYTKTLQTLAKLAVPDLADWCTVDMLDDHGSVQQVALAHKDPKKVLWAQRLRKQQGQIDLNAPTGVANVLRTGKSELYPEITDELLVASITDEKELKLTRSLGLSSLMIVPLKVEGKTVGAITLISAELKRFYSKADLKMAEDVANRASLAMTNAQLYKTAQDDLAERLRLEEQLRLANEALEGRVKERTAQLQITNQELARSNRELQDFAYVASHDLQEPLRKIQAFGNLLEEEYAARLAGDGADYLSRMQVAAARMSVLIEDLLAFSRVTSKAQPFVSVDLNTVTKEVLGDLEIRLRDTGGRVEAVRLPHVMADPLQMRQLLQNLIGNALKFVRPGVVPVVKLYADTRKTKDGRIKEHRLYVEDNGIGFEEKYLDRIFEVFQRLHSKDNYRGTGIGLAICRKIAERHGGTITAKSTPNKGSTFIISLPAASAERRQ